MGRKSLSLPRVIHFAPEGSEDFAQRIDVAFEELEGFLRNSETKELAEEASQRSRNLFYQTFEDDIFPSWPVVSGDTANVTYPNNGQAGGRALRFDQDGQTLWAYFPENIPFEPDRRYRFRARARTVTPDTGGEQIEIDIGVYGVAADGEAFVSINGNDTLNNPHFVVANQKALPDNGDWVEMSGYFQGRAVTGSSGPDNDPTSPGALHEDVRYFRPVFKLNRNLTDGVVELDFMSIDVLTDEQELDALDTVNAPAEAGADVTAGKSLSVLVDRVMANITDAGALAVLNQVDSGEIVDGAIIESKIFDGSVTTVKVNNAAISEAKIEDAAVTTVKIDGKAVTRAKIGDLAVDTGQLAAGAVDLTKFAGSLEPVDVVSSLPNPSGYTGPNTVLLTTDNKLYRYDSSVPEWTAAVPTSDLTGSITETQITDGSITTPKLAANAVEAGKIAADAIVAGKIAADAVDAGTIAAGAINASDLFVSGVVQSAAIATGAVIADKIAADAIVASKIAADAVTATHIDVATLDAIAVDAGTITAGLLQNAAGTNEIDLSATGNEPFILTPNLTVEADGDATFGGLVSSDKFDADTASFKDRLIVGYSTYGFGASASPFEVFPGIETGSGTLLHATTIRFGADSFVGDSQFEYGELRATANSSNASMSLSFGRGIEASHEILWKVEGTTGDMLVPEGDVIIGTDPGGTHTLRVGGGSRIEGQLDLNLGTSGLALNFRNDYDIFAEDTGAGTDNTRLWVDMPDGGDLIFGPRAGADLGNRFGLIRIAEFEMHEATDFVIGTDPGGTALLRVGGNIRADSIFVVPGAEGNSYQLRPSQNEATGVAIRATTNPAGSNPIFTVESSGSATRFGVTQSSGGWFHDGLIVKDGASLPGTNNAEVENVVHHGTGTASAIGIDGTLHTEDA